MNFINKNHFGFLHGNLHISCFPAATMLVRIKISEMFSVSEASFAVGTWFVKRVWCIVMRQISRRIVIHSCAACQAEFSSSSGWCVVTVIDTEDSFAPLCEMRKVANHFYGANFHSTTKTSLFTWIDKLSAPFGVAQSGNLFRFFSFFFSLSDSIFALFRTMINYVA